MLQKATCMVAQKTNISNIAAYIVKVYPISGLEQPSCCFYQGKRERERDRSFGIY